MLSKLNGVVTEDYYDENHFFVCSCGDLSDHLIITVYRWEESFDKFAHQTNFEEAVKDCIEVALYPSSAHYLGFFSRLWAALKYVFLKKKCGHDIMEFRTPDIKKIRSILIDFRVNVASLAKVMNSQLPAPIDVTEKTLVFKCKNGKEVVFSLDDFSREEFDIDVLQMIVVLPNVGFFKRIKFGWSYLKQYQKDGIVNLSYEDAGKLHSFLAKMK